MAVFVGRSRSIKSDFEPVWSGLKRCLECGFVLATEDSEERSDVVGKENKPKYPKEYTLHSTYHGKFYKVRSQYGSENILSYKQLRELDAKKESLFQTIRANDYFKELKEIHLILEEMKNSFLVIDKWIKIVSGCSERIKMDCVGIQDDLNALRKNLSKLETVKANPNDVVLLAKVIGHFYQVLEFLNYAKSSKEVEYYDSPYKDVELCSVKMPLTSSCEKVEGLLKKTEEKMSNVSTSIDTIIRIEYTKSLRLWDLCKLHPRFEDYKSLLWNTEKFQKLMEPYMSKRLLNFFVNSNLANRELVDSKFVEAPFYFGKVKEKVYKTKKKGIKDFSYMDNLIELPDEDDGISVSNKEIEDAEKVMYALDFVLKKKKKLAS